MGGSRNQVNKAHKARFASKSSRNLHKNSLQDKHRIAKSNNVTKGARAARIQRNKMLRENKKAALLKEKRVSSGSSSPPRVIVLFGLSADVDVDSLGEDLLKLLSPESTGAISSTVASSEYKLRATAVHMPKKLDAPRYLDQRATASLKDKAIQDLRNNEKLKLRLGTVEEGLKKASNFTTLYDSPKAKKSHGILGFLTSSSGKENAEIKANRDIGAAADPKEIKCNRGSKEERQNKGNINPSSEDMNNRCRFSLTDSRKKIQI